MEGNTIEVVVEAPSEVVEVPDQDQVVVPSVNPNKGRVVQKNYVLNDSAALQKKLRNETKRKEAFDTGTDAKDGSNVLVLMKTSFFEHVKAAFIQDLKSMEGVTAVDNAVGTKVHSENSGDAFVEYAMDVSFEADKNSHSIKLTAYATTCKIFIQPLGEKSKTLEHLGKKTVVRYFVDSFLLPWCETALAKKEYVEKELIDALKKEIAKHDLLKVDTRRGSISRARITSVPTTEVKCVARNCKYTALNPIRNRV